ncbi:hypothetical protein Clacol_005177 [Clathrus columnatus]|uniref:Uncharacterized protein n=1 Tax=Clathrus columnatus TaxID=1419009 RepID=A0AAV5AE52_9AGAM|nr:hypothetical protein Clacol_005177 [Clathrus columnatus]
MTSKRDMYTSLPSTNIPEDSNPISSSESAQRNDSIIKETEEPKPPPQVTFPNGGLVAWLNVFGSTFMLSLAQAHHYYEVFLPQALGQGIAMGCMFLPSVPVLAQYLSVRRSIVMGLGVSGMKFLSFPSLGLALTFRDRVFNSWRSHSHDVEPPVQRYLGFIALGMLIIANLIMKPRFPRRPSPSKEENIKLLKKILTDTPFHFVIIGYQFPYTHALLNDIIILGFILSMFQQRFSLLQLFGIFHGINETLAFYSIAIMNMASFFGIIIPNFAADHYGAMNIVGPSALISGALIFAMFGAKTVTGFVVFAILYGFFSGACLALSLAGCTAFLDNMSEVGIQNGIVMWALSFALLTGNPIFGALLHPPEYRWERPVIFCGVSFLMNLIHKEKD